MIDLLYDTLRLTLWLGLLAAVFVPLERRFALHQAPVLRAQWQADLGHYFFNGLVLPFLLALPLGLLSSLAQRWMPDAWLNGLSALPWGARLGLSLLVAETGFYWGHRLSHTWPWLWRFHAVHHSAGQMDFLVNTRAHPLDMLFTRLLGLAPLYALGLAGASTAGSTMPVAVILLGTVWGFFVHANVRWRFGPLEWLVATPAFHHWHHSLHEPVNRNYAAMLPMVDWMFGSLHLPRSWPSAYGCETAVPDRLVGQWLSPWRRRGLR
ncbi:sterol desaturase family protein [Ideonella sp.]|uniref:sterol desaturase family protein n=1 Tax=Ideonella sp. TaxID=1929293 RepID=UPI003BB60DA3